MLNGEPRWTPKCDVVLHPNDASYLREVGAGATSTVASSLVTTRPDIFAAPGRRPLAAIALATAPCPDELTHVILADCFVGRVVPRWIDEGPHCWPIQPKRVAAQG